MVAKRPNERCERSQAKQRRDSRACDVTALDLRFFQCMYRWIYVSQTQARLVLRVALHPVPLLSHMSGPCIACIFLAPAGLHLYALLQACNSCITAQERRAHDFPFSHIRDAHCAAVRPVLTCGPLPRRCWPRGHPGWRPRCCSGLRTGRPPATAETPGRETAGQLKK